MYELSKAAGYLLAPLTLVMGLGLAAALCVAIRRRGWAAGLVAAAFMALWLASTPWVEEALTRTLEARYPASTVEQTPAADAILILGGALSGASPPIRPTFAFSAAAGRVWHAAALYRAGKAKWVIISGGNQPDSPEIQTEADAIAEMLSVLGVPRSAMRLEDTSRTTRENAARTRLIVDELKARRVLLVTSATHMDRALKTFAKVWGGTDVRLVPAPTDFGVPNTAGGLRMWLPTASALSNVTKTLKEFAGLWALAII